MPPTVDFATRSPADSLTSVALGAYTEITKILAPEGAIANSTVTVQVMVKNLHSLSIYVAVTGLYDTTELFSYPEYATVEPGKTRTFTLSFVMPNYNVRVRAFSHYWIGFDWYQDDDGYIDIASIAGWIKLATKTITLTPIVWQKLAMKTITLTPIEMPPPVGWVKLASKTITLTPIEVPPVGWIKLASKTITLTPIGVPPVPPEKEKEFPWVPVLIGGGALVAVAGLASARKG